MILIDSWTFFQSNKSIQLSQKAQGLFGDQIETVVLIQIGYAGATKRLLSVLLAGLRGGEKGVKADLEAPFSGVYS